MQQGSRGHDRRHAIFIVVDGVPVVVPIRAAHCFGLHGLARINQLEALILAADMEVRLKRREARRAVQPGIPVSADDGVRWDIDVGRGLLPELLRPTNVLGHGPLGIKHDADLYLYVGFLTDGVEVIVHLRLLAGLQQDSGIGRVDLGVLAGRVLHEELAALRRAVIAIALGVRVR